MWREWGVGSRLVLSSVGLAAKPQQSNKNRQPLSAHSSRYLYVWGEGVAVLCGLFHFVYTVAGVALLVLAVLCPIIFIFFLFFSLFLFLSSMYVTSVGVFCLFDPYIHRRMDSYTADFTPDGRETFIRTGTLQQLGRLYLVREQTSSSDGKQA